MAARNKPAGIRSLVYGIGKGKAGIEGLSVSAPLLGLKPRPSYLLAYVRSNEGSNHSV